LEIKVAGDKLKLKIIFAIRMLQRLLLHIKRLSEINRNQTACADFPTQVAAPQGPLQNKMLHFSVFFVPGDIDL